MKTNHQRNFVRTRHFSGKDGRGNSSNISKEDRMAIPIISNFVRWFEERKCKLSGKIFYGAVTHQHGHPHHGFAHAKKGAKKFLNSRERFHENQAVRRMATELRSGK